MFNSVGSSAPAVSAVTCSPLGVVVFPIIVAYCVSSAVTLASIVARSSVHSSIHPLEISLSDCILEVVYPFLLD